MTLLVVPMRLTGCKITKRRGKMLPGLVEAIGCVRTPLLHVDS